MAYQVVKKRGSEEDILGVFPRREHAEIFRDAYASRMQPFWVTIIKQDDEVILYDQETDETVVVYIR